MSTTSKIAFVIGLLTVPSFALIYAPSAPIVYEAPEEVAEEEPSIPEPVVEPAEELTGQLKRICACESTGDPNAEPRHFDANGNVLRGRKNNLDVGQCQINEHYHGERAASHGLDLEDPNDNIRFAKLLYAEQGSQPWYWSKSCWN